VRTIDTVRLVAPHLDAEAETKKIEEREATDTEGVLIMPGAADLLRALPPERWCIVTSGTRRVASSRLQAGHLPIPRVMVTGSDVVKGKPDPEPYLKGAELLGMNPAECLVVEDAPAGIRAAHAGGMKVIALLTTYPAAELQEADAVVRALADIRVYSESGKLRVEA
jgi:sugar-phosphatase